MKNYNYYLKIEVKRNNYDVIYKCHSLHELFLKIESTSFNNANTKFSVTLIDDDKAIKIIKKCDYRSLFEIYYAKEIDIIQRDIKRTKYKLDYDMYNLNLDKLDIVKRYIKKYLNVDYRRIKDYEQKEQDKNLIY